MKAIMKAFGVMVVASALACAGTQEKKDQTQAPQPPPGPPTCGNWVVVVEKPTVASGNFQPEAIHAAVIEGLGKEGCTALTAPPANLPAGVSVLTVSVNVSKLGEGGRVSLIATDTSTGSVKWRLQGEIVAGGDGLGASRRLGRDLAGRITG